MGNTLRFSKKLFFLLVCVATILSQHASAHVAASEQSVRDQIKVLLADLPAGTQYSVKIVSLTKKKTLFEANATKPLTPASTTKLFTTFSALKMLGSHYTIQTQVYADNLPDSRGVVTGNLYLVGHGNPLLSVSDIEELVSQLKNAGVTAIKGDIIADASFFDDVTARHVYSGDNDVVESMAPISALGISRNIVTVLVHNGKTQCIPPSSVFNVITSGSSRSKVSKPEKSKRSKQTKKSSKKQKEKSKAKKPLRGGKRVSGSIAVHSNLTHNGDALFSYNYPWSEPVDGSGTAQQVLKVNLTKSKNASQSFVIAKPDVAAAGTLHNRLESAGITVTGSVRRGRRTTSAKLMAETGFPLQSLISIINKKSDNFLAEHVFKLVGAVSANNTKSTAQCAQAAIQRIMDTLKIPYDMCRLRDGSGLCRQNLLTAASQVRLLEEIRKLDMYDSFLESLSVAGIDGTLKKRMKDSPAINNLRGKTGTLRNASALSGYVTSANGEELAFSLLFNGNSVGTYKKIENDICVLLATYGGSR